MEVVKKTNEYQVIKKRSGRYAVKGANKKWVNGDEKVKILVAEGLMEAPKAKEEPAPEGGEGDAEAAAAE